MSQAVSPGERPRAGKYWQEQPRGERMGNAAAENRETAKWDPAFTKQVANTVGPCGQAVVSRRSAKHGQRSAGRRGAGGVQPFRRHAHSRRIDLLAGLLRQIRVRPADLHPGPLRRIHGPAGRLAASSRASSKPAAKMPPPHCIRARWCWCSRAATTTRTGRRSARTPSTSTAAPATSGPPSKPECRSCLPCRSAARRPSCS